MRKLTNFFGSLCRDESGATMVEYALAVSLIAIVLGVAFSGVGQNAADLMNDVADCLADSTKCPQPPAPPANP